ncbi:MAG TPA: glycosyltransferase family 4 protein, partial [Clostridia bacterium]|nr:glycosyltransferase family 4 protein [Clostridia bacterium]
SLPFDHRALSRHVKVAWISFFPIEWLPDLPEPLRHLPRAHPASWQRVLLGEMRRVPGLKLHIFCLQKYYPAGFSFEREGVIFHCVKASMKLRVGSLFWWDALLLRNQLKGIQPDLVHAWGSERGAALVASRLGYPYLVTLQGLLEWYSEQVKLSRFTRLEARLEKPGLRRASVVTTESSFGVKWLREHYPHLEIHQVEHAPDWLFHQVERRPGTAPMQFLSIGPMSKLKGTDLLFGALDRLRDELDFRLTVVGVSPAGFLEEQKRNTSAAFWDRVTIRQGLPPQEIAREIAQAGLMLFPTRADTSPNSVKEAVAAGLPVVASRVGGIVDYVIPGRNGMLFEPGNLEGFIHAIRQAVHHPLFKAGAVEAETLTAMRHYLSPKVMGEKFLSAYRRVLQGGVDRENSFRT